MNTYRTVSPSPTASHAAYVACQAARDARLLGGDAAQQASAYDSAYAEALRGER